mmetsp:Transcript_27396/g.56066  ORF Transcript_27396/g.56066 Transcript_27396/m.56066 type:complete len:325 (-) Transcript_27396:165-1139(-)
MLSSTPSQTPQVRSRSNSITDQACSPSESDQTPNSDRVLRIIPRTKTVQSKKVKRTTEAVEVSVETIRALSSYSEVAAAASLGISVTALKHACRTLGFEKWPRHLSTECPPSQTCQAALKLEEQGKQSPTECQSLLASKGGVEVASMSTLFETTKESLDALSQPFSLNAATQKSELSDSDDIKRSQRSPSDQNSPQKDSSTLDRLPSSSLALQDESSESCSGQNLWQRMQLQRESECSSYVHDVHEATWNASPLLDHNHVLPAFGSHDEFFSSSTNDFECSSHTEAEGDGSSAFGMEFGKHLLLNARLARHQRLWNLQPDETQG